MIKLHETLWAVKGINREVEGSDHKLAYMTHASYLRDTEVPDKAFESRMQTGIKWAKSSKCREDAVTDPEVLTVGNTLPLTGFKIVGVASRWSTDNKLIQIEDPRGFIVEIPTGNLTTLLKYSDVKERTLTSSCVWGKEGNTWILLPTNSPEYEQAKVNTVQDASKIPLNQLEVGDVVKFRADDTTEMVYYGKAKCVWKVLSRGGRWRFTGDTDKVLGEIQDIKYRYIFESACKKYSSVLTSSKVIKIGTTTTSNRPVELNTYPTTSVVVKAKETYPVVGHHSFNPVGIIWKDKQKEQKK